MPSDREIHVFMSYPGGFPNISLGLLLTVFMNSSGDLCEKKHADSKNDS